MNRKKILGIDFGTTYTEVGYLGDDGRPNLIKTPSGNQKLRTAAWYKDGGEPKFGQSAVRAAPVHPDLVLKEFKPELDKSETEFVVDGKNLSPVEVAKTFYAHIKEQAENELGENVDETVITVPAYFFDFGYEVMKSGAEKAGFTVKRVLREPASAAVAYAIDNPLNERETIMVYDFGGGTFDVSLMTVNVENGSPKFDVIGNRGDTGLGGHDIDKLIYEEIFVKRFTDKYQVDPTEKPEVVAEWLTRAEDLKKALSEDESGADYIQAKARQLPIELTREDFNKLIEPTVDTTLDITKKLLQETSTQTEDIDRLVLVGGTTRVPLVKKKVEDFIGLQAERGVDPDLAVVSGAILIAGAKGGETIRDKNGVRVPLLASEVRDVTSHGIGVKAVDPATMEEYNSILIKKGEPLRAIGQDVFHPVGDDAKYVHITIIEGDSHDLNKCKILQENYKLEISVEKKSDNVDITVEIAVNKNGLIEIIAETPFGDRIRKEFQHPSILNQGGN